MSPEVFKHRAMPGRMNETRENHVGGVMTGPILGGHIASR